MPSPAGASIGTVHRCASARVVGRDRPESNATATRATRWRGGTSDACGEVLDLVGGVGAARDAQLVDRAVEIRIVAARLREVGLRDRGAREVGGLRARGSGPGPGRRRCTARRCRSRPSSRATWCHESSAAIGECVIVEVAARRASGRPRAATCRCSARGRCRSRCRRSRTRGCSSRTRGCGSTRRS